MRNEPISRYPPLNVLTGDAGHNAIAPGFFVGGQNRTLLLNEDGSVTARDNTIIDHTSAGRFGEPDDLISTLTWLCGPGASFVNDIVVPVDGALVPSAVCKTAQETQNYKTTRILRISVVRLFFSGEVYDYRT